MNDLKEINLKDGLAVLKRRIWLITVTTAFFTLAGVFMNSQPVTPLYKADTRLILNSEQEYISTLLVMVKEPVVMESVIRELGLTRSAASLRSQISISIVNNSQVANLSVVDPDPHTAVNIANKTVEAYKRTLTEVLGWSDVKVLTEAAAGDHPTPINPKTNRLVGLGFMAGMVLGIGLAFLAESLDDSIRTRHKVEQLLGLRVLGSVGKITKKTTIHTHKQEHSSVVARSETIGS
jgi:capsular polysaccharide biosynthesis protein